MSCCNVREIQDYVSKWGYNTASGMSCCNATVTSAADGSVEVLQYRKRYELLQLGGYKRFVRLESTALQYRKRYELLQRPKCASQYAECSHWLQYRKRYELLQRGRQTQRTAHCLELQYRKRYELLQHSKRCLEAVSYEGYNTASGMSCCNLQYILKLPNNHNGYNTASGMSCCNWLLFYWCSQRHNSYNTASGMSCCNYSKQVLVNSLKELLQYRKRYELLQPFLGVFYRKGF